MHMRQANSVSALLMTNGSTTLDGDRRWEMIAVSIAYVAFVAVDGWYLSWHGVKKM